MQSLEQLTQPKNPVLKTHLPHATKDFHSVSTNTQVFPRTSSQKAGLNTNVGSDGRTYHACCDGGQVPGDGTGERFDAVIPKCLKGLHVFSSRKTEVIDLHISSGVLLWHGAREKTLHLHSVHKQDNFFISAQSALFTLLAFIRGR